MTVNLKIALTSTKEEFTQITMVDVDSERIYFSKDDSDSVLKLIGHNLEHPNLNQIVLDYIKTM